jgi:predicted ATPase/class 3 adenylate cyclase
LATNRPSGTVTFLFTDIEGSTRLAREHPEKWETLQTRHHAIVQAAIKANDGYFFQIIGDAFCAAFHTAEDAINAAIQSQKDLQAEKWGETPIRVRMGIHTGKADLRDDGQYSSYMALSHVQRLMSAGHGGQVLVSAATQELVRDDVPAEVSLRDLGERWLKDLIRPEHIYQLVTATLPADFPPLKTLDVHRHNLPARMTTFIGREKEMTEIKQALDKNRLVTLTGSGGTGKTRLALQVAADLLDQFPNGVWFIELAPLTDPDLVPQTILITLGLNDQEGKSILQSLIASLHEKKVLLVLDNCEHLIETCAAVANTLLIHAPALQILASSREALGVAGEMTWRVPPLSMPNVNQMPVVEQLTQYEAVELFAARAVLAQQHFTVNKDNAHAIAQICFRLDGIPLAIELAAARLKTLSIEQIAKRLDDSFHLLAGGPRTALPRHQTLRTTIDWSYNLLSEDEQELFCNLAVFAGGWTLESAEKICAEAGSGVEILDLLSRLVDKSLVSVERSVEGARYHLLETTRQYAQNKLLEADRGDQMRDRHLDYYLGLAEAVEPRLYHLDQLMWNVILDSELDNVRAALEWSLTTSRIEAGLRIVNALHRFWVIHVYWREAYGWLQRLLASPQMRTQTPLHARTLFMAGHLATYFGDGTIAHQFGEESLRMCRALNYREGIVNASWLLGWLDSAQLDGTALPHFQESLTLAREDGYTWGAAHCLAWYGNYMLSTGDYEAAESLLNEGIVEIHKLGGDLDIWAWCDANLGLIAMLQGKYTEAESLLDESLSLFEQSGGKYGAAETLWLQGRLALRLGDFGKAIRDFRDGIMIVRDYVTSQWATKGLAYLAITHAASGRPVLATKLAGALSANERAPGLIHSQLGSRAAVAEYDSAVAALRGVLSKEEFSAAWEDGHAMRTEQALELALGERHE